MNGRSENRIMEDCQASQVVDGGTLHLRNNTLVYCKTEDAGSASLDDDVQVVAEVYTNLTLYIETDNGQLVPLDAVEAGSLPCLDEIVVPYEPVESRIIENDQPTVDNEQDSQNDGRSDYYEEDDATSPLLMEEQIVDETIVDKPNQVSYNESLDINLMEPICKLEEKEPDQDFISAPWMLNIAQDDIKSMKAREKRQTLKSARAEFIQLASEDEIIKKMVSRKGKRKGRKLSQLDVFLGFTRVMKKWKIDRMLNESEASV